MIGGIVPTYRCDSLGAPFAVDLVNCVISAPDGITIPDLPGLIATVVVERLRDARRLGGPELRFLRKAVGATVQEMGAATGLGIDEVETYEEGARPMNAAAEKIARLYLHHRLRRRHPGEDAGLFEFLDFVFDWRPAPTLAGVDGAMRLSHQSARGWHRLA